MNKFLNIGHRGAAAYAHENTTLSISKAIKLRADMVELDLRRTADGRIILFHDRTIKTDTGRKAVSKISFDELERAAEIKGYSVATFEDAIRKFGKKIPMIIEIKARLFEDSVVEIMNRHQFVHPPIISSFYPWVVGKVKSLDDKVKTGLIIGQGQVSRFGFLAMPVLRGLLANLRLNSMHIEASLASAPIIKRLKDLGLGVYVWTVDDYDQMKRLIEMRVDGIITNKPDVLYNACLELSRASSRRLRKLSADTGRFAYID